MPRILATLILLCCATLVAAVDVQAVLAGNWTMTGMVNLSQDEDESIHMGEMPKIAAVFAGSTITMTMPGTTMTITWKVLAEKPEGFEIEMTGGMINPDGKPKKGRLVVVEDGVILAQNMNDPGNSKAPRIEFGTKFVRSDGKPVGLPPSAKPAPKPAEAIKAADPELAKRFTCEVRELTLSREISFEDGDLSAPTVVRSGRLDLKLTWPKGVAVVRQEKEIEVLEAVTDSGESLVLDKKDKSRSRYGYSGNVHDKTLYTGVNIAAPAKPAKTIRTLRANIRLAVENAAGKSLVFPKIATWVGKEQSLPDTEVPVAITSLTDDELVYTIKGDGELVKSVTIVDAGGAVISSHVRRSSSDGESSTCTLKARKAIPADATVRFQCVGQTSIIAVPITITDIPLGEEPATPAGDGKALF